MTEPPQESTIGLFESLMIEMKPSKAKKRRSPSALGTGDWQLHSFNLGVGAQLIPKASKPGGVKISAPIGDERRLTVRLALLLCF